MGEQPNSKDYSQYTEPAAEHVRTDQEQYNLAEKDSYKLLEGLPIESTAVHHAAPLQFNEEARLNALKHLGVLDTAHEQRFDDITQLVCSIFDVPIAIVSVIDTDRQWFKSCVGLACSETDRKSSFCAWTLVPKNPEVLVVPDATEDVRCQPISPTPAYLPAVYYPSENFVSGSHLLADHSALLTHRRHS